MITNRIVSKVLASMILGMVSCLIVLHFCNSAAGDSNEKKFTDHECLDNKKCSDLTRASTGHCGTVMETCKGEDIGKTISYCKPKTGPDCFEPRGGVENTDYTVCRGECTNKTTPFKCEFDVNHCKDKSTNPDE